MTLTCIGCEEEFEAAAFRGYCDECIAGFKTQREHVHQKQNPAPGVHACGKFTQGESPKSVWDPTSERNVCGICGGEEIESGYGLGGGYGCGSYNFCHECYAVLDFSEDTGE
jgi:hypothetical protein